MLTVIVDGDNITRALHLTRPPQVEEFLQQLEMAAIAKDWEVIVVFDGPQRFFPREEGPLVVRYALGRTADSMIERTVYKSASRSEMIVVTHDRAEGNLVLGMGGRVWNAQRLQEEMG